MTNQDKIKKIAGSRIWIQWITVIYILDLGYGVINSV